MTDKKNLAGGERALELAAAMERVAQPYRLPTGLEAQLTAMQTSLKPWMDAARHLEDVDPYRRGIRAAMEKNGIMGKTFNEVTQTNMATSMAQNKAIQQHMDEASARRLTVVAQSRSMLEEARRALAFPFAEETVASITALSPFAKMKKDLDTLMRPYRDVQATQAALAALDPYRSFLGATERTRGIEAISLNAMDAGMSSALERMQRRSAIPDYTEQLAAINSPFRARAGVIEQFLSSYASTAKEFAQLNDSRGIMAAAARAAEWDAPYKALSKSLEHLTDPFGGSSVRAIWESVTRPGLREELLAAAAQLQDSEDAGEEVVSLVQGVTEEVSKALTAQDAVDQIVLAIQATNEPRHKWILAVFFLPLLFLFVSPFWNSYVDFHMKKSLEGVSTQAANKQVKEAAREAVGDLRLLRDYRFVSAQSLAVRSEPKARGQALGQLRLGQTVHVLGKEGDFTLVVWQSEDGNSELKGWVFSRYLKRFQ